MLMVVNWPNNNMILSENSLCSNHDGYRLLWALLWSYDMTIGFG